jgi:hypothetical protein
MAEHFAKQEAQWEWERKEKDEHNGHVEKSLDNIEMLLSQQVSATQAAAGALQHVVRIAEAFVRRSSLEVMANMPTAPPEYNPLPKKWRKKLMQDKGEGGSGEKGKEKEKEGEDGDKEVE